MPKNRRKKQRRRTRTRAKSTVRGAPEALREGLIEAGRLQRQRKWAKARELLEGLDRHYPRRAEVLGALVDLYYELGDITSGQSACQRLASLRPDDPEVRLMLAGSCMSNVYPALALRNFRVFLEHWPDDPRADEVRRTVASLEAEMGPLLEDLGLTGEDGLQLAALHEEVLCCLQQGQFDQGRQVAEQLLERHPGFVPAINNLGETYFREGRADEAVAAARRVLQQDPDNFHALANLTRYLCLSGRADEAQPWAERLKSVRSTHSDVWIKKAETFSYLGDDHAVLEAYQGARQHRDWETDRAEGLLNHLAAVAALRLGREKDARRHWKRALKLDPGLDVAEANLEDLNKPQDQRHGPWAYEVNHWLPEGLVRKLISRLDRVQRRGNEGMVAREARRFLQNEPQLAAILPMLLDRGDPTGREFAFRVAMLAQTPEALEALHDFALSRRGPDRLRHEAVPKLRETGRLPAGPARMWIKGQWHDTLLFGFEIHDEPSRAHQPEVEDLACEAITALKSDDAQAAERLFKQALQIEPHAVDLLNNLATAYRLQGRFDEWRRLVHEIHQRDPDYLFGRVNMALDYLEGGDTEEARKMLHPLLSRQRFHRSEFAALGQAQIELCLAEGHLDGARLWLDVWKDIDPDHPDLDYWQDRVAPRRLRRTRSRPARR